MKKEFSMSNDKVTVNFTAKYCDSFESIMDSEGFERVIESYLKKSKDKRTNTFRFLNSVSGTDEIKFIRKVKKVGE